MHPHELKVLAAEIAQSVGMRIADMCMYQMLELETESGNIYSLVVIDPERSLVAVQDKRQFKKPVRFVLQGSTKDSYVLHTGCIDLGRQLEFTNSIGIRVTTSLIVSLRPIDDPERAHNLAEEALSNPLFQ